MVNCNGKNTNRTTVPGVRKTGPELLSVSGPVTSP